MVYLTAAAVPDAGTKRTNRIRQEITKFHDPKAAPQRTFNHPAAAEAQITGDGHSQTGAALTKGTGAAINCAREVEH